MSTTTQQAPAKNQWFGASTARRGPRVGVLVSFAAVAALGVGACGNGDGGAQQTFQCVPHSASPNVPTLLANAVNVRWDDQELEYVGESRINDADELEKLELEPYSRNMVHVEHGDREAGWVYDECFRDYPLWKKIEVDFKKHRNAKNLQLPSAVKVDQYKPKAVTATSSPAPTRSSANNGKQNTQQQNPRSAAPVTTSSSAAAPKQGKK
ncbi:MAG: hypothetical protein HOQ05_01460 [Corynebacteriales bacterium]|nr:hypothetical protein [Mycobacteriales bacterium]